MAVQLDTNTGLLPVGEHQMDWRRVCELFGTTTHRQNLLELMLEACIILRDAGVPKIWLNGSFVTSKHRPGDYDLSYELNEEIFTSLPDDPFKQKDADRIIRARFAGDIKAEPMHDGATYHEDLFPNVVGHNHQGQAIHGVKKGIVVLPLSTLPT